MKSRIDCEYCAMEPANWTIADDETGGTWYACDGCKSNRVKRLTGDELYTVTPDFATPAPQP